MKKNFSLPSEALEQLREPPCMERTLAKLETAWPKMDDYKRGQLDMLVQIVTEGSVQCQR